MHVGYFSTATVATMIFTVKLVKHVFNVSAILIRDYTLQTTSQFVDAVVIMKRCGSRFNVKRK